MNPNTPPAMHRPVIHPNVGVALAGPLAGLQSTDRAVREEILHRAYAIWEREGHPADRKLANWLEAEGEVMAGR